MQQQILSITQVNEYIRGKMDQDRLLMQLAVRGEISNYKMYPSGHHYFTLKDDGAALKCVMFKSSASKLRFRPENGMKVIALGRITVYPRDGAYQLYCSAMVVDGVGDLYAAFEQLKAKLAEKGLFAPEHKKKLPAYPNVIGIVTSSAGAAVHDMLRILKKRYPLVTVRLFPVRVQGTEAPGEISAAIRYANRYHLADLLIVGRGGGSIEDLWAFNDEQVAYAIYDSEIPIISAVGHEPDVTISDFVADLRAATPSNAAELAVPDQAALLQNMDAAAAAMQSAMMLKIRSSRQRLEALAKSPVMFRSTAYLEKRQEALEHLTTRLISAETQLIQRAKHGYVENAAKLDAMSPLKVIARGYSIASTADGTVLRSVKQTRAGEEVHITLADGRLQATVTNIEEGTK